MSGFKPRNMLYRTSKMFMNRYLGCYFQLHVMDYSSKQIWQCANGFICHLCRQSATLIQVFMVIVHIVNKIKPLPYIHCFYPFMKKMQFSEICKHIAYMLSSVEAVLFLSWIWLWLRTNHRPTNLVLIRAML